MEHIFSTWPTARRIFQGMLTAATLVIAACGGSGSPDQVLSSSGQALSSPRQLQIVSANLALEKWRPYEFEFTSNITYSEPAKVGVSATFMGPGGATLVIPGFYTEFGKWVVRFSPTAVGPWSYRTTSTDSQLNGKTGTFTAVVNPNPKVHGKLQIDPSNPNHFVWEDGSRHFMLGYELDWLASLSLNDPNIVKTKQMIDTVANHGFTEILMAVYADDTTWTQGISTFGIYDFGPAARRPWLGTKASPLFYQPDPEYWNNLDRVIEYMHQKGLTAHLYLRMQYNKYLPFSGFVAQGSAEENFFIRYAMARYQAYPNVIWDYQKESSNAVDKPKYYAGLQLIKSLDAYKKLRTAHDADSLVADPVIIKDLDYYTDQDHATTANLYSSTIYGKNIKNWPFYNAEGKYQKGVDGIPTFTVGDEPESVFENAMEIIMAGGYTAYYHVQQAWDVIKWDMVPAKLYYYRHLTSLLNTTKWYSMKPSDQFIGGGAVGKHCLANEGREYLVYLGRNASSVSLTVTNASSASGTPLQAKWVDLETGAQTVLANVGNGTKTFNKPVSGNPAMLYLFDPNAVVGGNQVPSVNAGPDVNLALGSSVTLTGIVSDDGLPSGAAVSQQWTAEGPGAVAFSSPTATRTVATFTVPGTYTLKLTAFDTSLYGFDILTVKYGAANQAPLVDAGVDMSTLVSNGSNLLNLTGSVSDDGLPSGAVVSLQWTKDSGPGNVVFSTPNQLASAVSFSAPGAYVLRLTANDSALSGSDTLTVTVSRDVATGDGLTGQYFSNKTVTGPAALTRVDPKVEFSWGTGAPVAGLPVDNFSVTWSGFIQAPVSGNYTFYVSSNDGNRLWINGVQITNRWVDGVAEDSGAITLVAGQRYSIKLDMYENVGSALATLSWLYPGQAKQVVPQANLFSR